MEGKISVYNMGGKKPRNYRREAGLNAESRKSSNPIPKSPEKNAKEEEKSNEGVNQTIVLRRRPGRGESPTRLTHAERTRINVDTLFDFRPFIYAPACVESAKQRGGTIFPIRVRKELQIPSPLAENIHPSRLPEIKKQCEVIGRKGYNKSNQEVWLSWKRAYDLWNNHYIEGRVNVKWVQETMEEVREQIKNRNRKRKERPFTKKEPLRLGSYGTIVCFEEELKEIEGRKWIPTGETEKRKITDESKSYPTGRKIKPKKKAIFGSAFEQKTYLIFPKPQPLSGEIAGEEKEAKQPAMELIKVNAPKGNQKKTGDYANLKKPMDDREDPEEHVAKRVKGELEAWVRQEAPAIALDSNSEEVDEGETKPQWAIVPVWELVDDPNALTTPKRQKTTKDGKHSTQGDEASADSEEGEYDDPNNWNIHNDDGVEDDGSSGGFISMKALAAGTTIDERNDEHANERICERVDNTVWRPRRVGEEPSEINANDRQRVRAEQEEANESDFARFRPSNYFEVDGGVDCATAPFPLLRWAHSYLRNSEGLFRKRKVWDRVTGTVFNMPTTPQVKKTEPDSEKGIANPSHGDIFPLDIRRVQKVIHDQRLSVNSRDEDIVELKGMETLRSYRRMTQDDPWWVHPDQEYCRDVPPRRWPIAKGHDREGELLPYDDLDWQDHRKRDADAEYMYFATNLHGGTLLINGVEVGKGDIVGPLPQFAIIESPGGQVSFWHGLKGREFGNAKPLSQKEEHEQWEHLRQSSPEWKYAGVYAGKVWAARIEDRVKREEDGIEGEPDNDIWKAWKEWKEPDPNMPLLAYQSVGRLGEHLDYDITTSLMNPRPPPGQEVTERLAVSDSSDSDNVRVPPAFSSPEEELKHLAIINVEFEKRVKALTKNPVIQPQGSNFWNGKKKARDYPAISIVENRVIQEQWANRREKIESKHKEYVERMKNQPQPGVRKTSGDSNGHEGGFDLKEPDWWEEVLRDLPLTSLTQLERDRQREALIEQAKLEYLTGPDIVRQAEKRRQRQAVELEEQRQKQNAKRKANNLPEIPESLTAVQILAKREEVLESDRAEQLKKKTLASVKALKLMSLESEVAKLLRSTPRERSKTPPPLPSAPVKDPKTPSPKKPPPKTPAPATTKTPKKVYRNYSPHITGDKLKKFRLWDYNYIDGKMHDEMVKDVNSNTRMSDWFTEYIGIITQETQEISEGQRRRDLRKMFKNQAASAEMEVEDFAKSKGFDSLEAMVSDSMQQSNDADNLDNPDITYTFPGFQKPRYSGKGGTAEKNFYSDWHLSRALQEGLRAVAKQRGMREEDVMKEEGHDSWETYRLENVWGFFREYEDLPRKKGKNDKKYKKAQKDDQDKFQENMGTSKEFQKFEVQIENIERDQPAETRIASDGKRFAVI